MNMLGDDDNEKSERLIPVGTEDSAAIGADEVKRFKLRSLKAVKNGSVTEAQPPVVLQMTAVPDAAIMRQQPQQQHMQRSQQQPRQKQPPAATQKRTGPNTRQAQLQQQLTANDDDEESYVYEPKQGHNLFFFLCDTKRALLILGSFDFFILALSMTRNLRDARANGVAFDMSNEFTKNFITQACALFIDICTIVGTMWYSNVIVLVGFLFKCYQLVVSSMSAAQNWQNDSLFIITVSVLAGLNVLFLYAAGMFMWETHKGILTKENYQRREKYSCCCEC
mmetsp:Transcript_26071/g.40953  ORF Transcript_26071/g.40953 Transcript_26071/m.40953 type:complete len:280 (-) Transcript_26071:149-988(-)